MYCSKCGKEVNEEAVICIHCGCQVNNFITNHNNSKPDEVMLIVVKVFLILGCIAQGWLIIPLAWCLPITIAIFNKLKTNEPIGTGLKICSLIFVNLIAGVCLLCLDDNN